MIAFERCCVGAPLLRWAFGCFANRFERLAKLLECRLQPPDILLADTLLNFRNAVARFANYIPQFVHRRRLIPCCERRDRRPVQEAVIAFDVWSASRCIAAQSCFSSELSIAPADVSIAATCSIANGRASRPIAGAPRQKETSSVPAINMTIAINTIATVPSADTA